MCQLVHDEKLHNFLTNHGAGELEPGESLPPAFGSCTRWHTTHVHQ